MVRRNPAGHTYLKPLLEVLGKSRFTISFDTRSETSGTFLQNIDMSLREANIDYHYICNAYSAITQWFDGKDGPHRIKFLQCLLNDDSLGRNVKVIWYELTRREVAVEAFTRLNVGKIPLTNAELIRALFLRSGNFARDTLTLQQLKIAQEWDGIEKALQSDAIWYFLQRGVDAPLNRIEFLFHLVANENAGQNELSDDPYGTFHFFNERLAGSVAAATEWLRVKQYFMSLEEWYNDPILYHLIGFLIHDGDDLLAIRRAGIHSAKSNFNITLKQRIYKRLIGRALPINGAYEQVRATLGVTVCELEYGRDSGKIRSFLLLFNLATLVQNPDSTILFPFDRFKKEEWDIEHIRSVESGKPSRPTAQRQWLEKAYDYLDDSGDSHALATRVQSLMNSAKIDGNAFDKLYSELLEYFREADDTETDDGIGNLTLLDSKTNSSYKNAVFPVKRRRILGLDRAGIFVPLCTKNVFMKCYSNKVKDMMFWSEDDRRNYRDAILETLTSFFVVADKGAL